MRTFLVLEGASKLHSGEAERLAGTVLTEAALIAWGARWWNTPPDAPFLVVAEAAKAAGVALFGLPTRELRHSTPDAEASELRIDGRPVLVVRRRGDPTGPARVRWQGDDGGTRETELPGFLADALASLHASPAIASEPAPMTPDPSEAPDAPASPGAPSGEAPRKSRKRKAPDGS